MTNPDMRTTVFFGLILALALPCYCDGGGHLSREAHRRTPADQWLTQGGFPYLEPMGQSGSFSHFRGDKYNHFSFSGEDIPSETSQMERIPDIGLQTLFGPPNPDDDISKLDELSTKKRYTKKSNKNAEKTRNVKSEEPSTQLWKKTVGETFGRDYPWNRSGEHGGISKLRRAAVGGGGWSKRGGVGQFPGGIASHLMLRSVRGNRQYDVPQIGESSLFTNYHFSY